MAERKHELTNGKPLQARGLVHRIPTRTLLPTGLRWILLVFRTYQQLTYSNTFGLFRSHWPFIRGTPITPQSKDTEQELEGLCPKAGCPPQTNVSRATRVQLPHP